jgi:hypothetical protein
MWKITTRGFTLAEVLIMAAMNLKASGDSAGKTRVVVNVSTDGQSNSCKV